MEEEKKSNRTEKSKRSICKRCFRPLPRACICAALPEQPLETFKKCRVVVLQHPHEAKRKNRSLPLVQLCLPVERTAVQNNAKDDERDCQMEDFNFRVIVARRFSDETDPAVMKMINDPNQDVMLLYPSPHSITLEQGLEEVKNRRMRRKEEGNLPKVDQKLTLIFLDATWKYAKEMERACTAHNVWPENMIRVQLSPVEQGENDVMKSNQIKSTVVDIIKKCDSKNSELDDQNCSVSNETNKETTSNNDNNLDLKRNLPPKGFRKRRFNIRTPPSFNHLSTAECIAWVLSAIEKKPHIYEVLMKPLDLMVEKWNSFSDKTNSSNKRNISNDRLIPGSFRDQQRQKKQKWKETKSG